LIKEHIISDEVLKEAQTAFSNNEYWLAYNTVNYFVDKVDMYFFKDKDSAIEFSENNISEYDNYKVIHARSVNELLRQIPYGKELEQNLINSKNMSIMNEQNLAYLKDNIKYHGFGETLNPELESQLQKGSPEFILSFKTEMNKKNLDATLYFKKSETTDMYFFNKYDVRAATEKNGETMAQTFYMNKGHGVTLKEAYNLLNGRSVHKELENKEGQKYHAWIKLDFSEKDNQGNFKRQQYHENYGYNLGEVLSKYPIKELMDEKQKEDLVKSLQKGNAQIVTVEMEGKDQKVFIEANPQFKTINLYDMKMQKMEKQSLQQSEGNDGQKKTLKTKVADEVNNKKNNRQGRKKGMSV
jgi:hypothetical protein